MAEPSIESRERTRTTHRCDGCGRLLRLIVITAGPRTRYALVEAAGTEPAGAVVTECPHSECRHPLPRLSRGQALDQLADAYGA